MNSSTKIIRSTALFIDSITKPISYIGNSVGFGVWLIFSFFQNEYSAWKLAVILTIVTITMAVGYARFLFDKEVYDETIDCVLQERVYGKFLSQLIKKN